ncbi:MAG: response regulator [Pyrinomonadaceae bacterium]
MEQRKLLLADDSITIQKVVNLTFADEGIDVTTVGDGDTALEKISEIAPDIVLLDVHMPGLNGYQLCEIIRENEATKNLPVILLVGSFEPFDENEATRVGANAHMTKPFHSIRELIAQVTGLLAAPEPAEDEAPIEIPETSDIENLYRDSFAETVEVREGQSSEHGFPDDGFDDEMIETSYTSPDAEDEDDFGGAFPPEEREEELTIEFEPVPLEEAADDEASPAPHNSPFDAPAETGIVTEFEPSYETEAESEAEGETTREPNIFDELEQAISGLTAANTISFDAIPQEISQPSHSFQDIDLLELPDVPGEKTFEFATPAGTRAAGGNKQVVSISPELMEIIVQKVVEKMAEKY